MKKIVPFIVLCAVMTAFTSCKRNQWKGLAYSSAADTDHVQAHVVNTEGKEVLWFEVFDQIDEQTTLDSYKSAGTKIDDTYPAKIFENKWIWMLINNRIEIRLIANDKSDEFKNTDKLKKFIMSFDLKGLERISGEKVKGQELKKYIPPLGEK